MGNELVYKLQHLLVTVKLGQAVTQLTGEPIAVQALVDIRPATDNPSAPPLDLRFVIDRSGSMAYNGKLEAVKTALMAAIDALQPKDRLTIVAFNSQFEVALKPTKMTAPGRVKARDAVDGLIADGNTFISSALSTALLFKTQPACETRTVLFTDGQCTTDIRADHLGLVQCADRARTDGLPLFIYGTGGDYNHSLLIQMAARAGNGSFLKHIMDTDVLLGHLQSEIGFLRGVGIRGLTVSGEERGDVTIKRVTRFMPMMQRVRVRLPIEKLGSPIRGKFIDDSGALDRARGQQYLLECIVPAPVNGEMLLTALTLQGRTPSGETFHEHLPMSVEFTADASKQSDPDPEVVKIMIMMAAAEQARQGNYNASADLYDQAGDHQTAQMMRTMQTHLDQRSRDNNDVDRGSQTTVGAAVSVMFTREM